MSIIYKTNNSKQTIFDTSNISNSEIIFKESINIIPSNSNSYSLKVTGNLLYTGAILNSNNKDIVSDVYS